MKPSYIIDNATAQDIPAMIELLAVLFGIEVDFKPDLEKQKKGLALLISHSENGVIKVAKDQQGKILGMVSAQLVISTAQGSPSAWVEDMVITESHRGEGLGKSLLNEALLWAKSKGATRAQLLVDTENKPALGYYQHLGWETTQLQARKIFI